MYSSAEIRIRTAIGYGIAAVFCFIFQAMYESYSHGVASNYMIYAFLIPLIGGMVSLLSSYRLRGNHGNLFRQLVCGGVVWLTLGSIFRGILEIYGTTNRLTVVFALTGGLQLAGAAVTAAAGRMKANRSPSGNDVSQW